MLAGLNINSAAAAIHAEPEEAEWQNDIMPVTDQDVGRHPSSPVRISVRRKRCQ